MPVATYAYGRLTPSVSIQTQSVAAPDITAAFITANGDTYQFTYYFKNLSGTSFYAPTVTATISTGQGLRLTLPTSTLLTSEKWHSIVICAKKPSETDFVQIFEQWLFDLNNVANANYGLSRFPLTIDLTTPEHYQFKKQVTSKTDFSTLNTSDYFNGALFYVQDDLEYYILYKNLPNNAAFNYAHIKVADDYFVYCPYGTKLPRIFYNVSPALDLNQDTQTPGRPVVYSPIYQGEDAKGLPQYFFLVNDRDEFIPAGTRIGFTIIVGGEDYSTAFAYMYRCRLLGYVNLDTFALDDKDETNLQPMENLGIEFYCIKDKTLFIITKDLPPNTAVLIQVYPQFYDFQIPPDLPANFSVKICPFFYLHNAIYVALGEFLGDFIFNVGKRLKVIPGSGTSAIMQSGSAVVNSHYFVRYSNQQLPSITFNTEARYLYIDFNGSPLITENPITDPNQLKALALRAILSSQSGYAGGHLVGTFTAPDDATTLTLDVTLPQQIRANYPIIGGDPVPFRGRLQVYVERVGSGGWVKASDPFNYTPPPVSSSTTTDTITLVFSSMTTVPALPSISTDPLFGFWNISNTLSNAVFDGTSTTSATYKVYVFQHYNGTELSKIDQRAESGCIPVASLNFDQMVHFLYNINEDLSDLESRIDVLETQNVDQQTAINALQTTVSNHTTTLNNHTTAITTLQNLIGDPVDTIADLEAINVSAIPAYQRRIVKLSPAEVEYIWLPASTSNVNLAHTPPRVVKPSSIAPSSPGRWVIMSGSGSGGGSGGGGGGAVTTYQYETIPLNPFWTPGNGQLAYIDSPSPGTDYCFLIKLDTKDMLQNELPASLQTMHVSFKKSSTTIKCYVSRAAYESADVCILELILDTGTRDSHDLTTFFQPGSNITITLYNPIVSNAGMYYPDYFFTAIMTYVNHYFRDSQPDTSSPAHVNWNSEENVLSLFYYFNYTENTSSYYTIGSLTIGYAGSPHPVPLGVRMVYGRKIMPTINFDYSIRGPGWQLAINDPPRNYGYDYPYTACTELFINYLNAYPLARMLLLPTPDITMPFGAFLGVPLVFTDLTYIRGDIPDRGQAQVVFEFKTRQDLTAPVNRMNFLSPFYIKVLNFTYNTITLQFRCQSVSSSNIRYVKGHDYRFRYSTRLMLILNGIYSLSIPGDVGPPMTIYKITGFTNSGGTVQCTMQVQYGDIITFSGGLIVLDYLGQA